MRSLAAAISAGYFGFTDWAFATEALSEIAVQVPIATRKNNALIIIFLSHSFILADALDLSEDDPPYALPMVRLQLSM